MTGTADRWTKMQARAKKWSKDLRERVRAAVLAGFCPDCHSQVVERTFWGFECMECNRTFDDNGYPEKEDTCYRPTKTRSM